MSTEDLGPVVGIDLGTTTSLIVMPVSDKPPTIIPNERGERITPSVVSFLPEHILVGELAKSQAVLNHDRTVAHVKRAMGTDLVWSFRNRQWSPEDISAEILKYLKRAAEEYLGRPVSEVVITVPAYFNDRQRQATMKAGELAGFHVLKLFNEPTAAALAYGLQQGEDDNLLVFDFGGGTLDITLLEIKDQAFLVRGVGGASDLGGVDIDRLIVEHLSESFCTIHDLSLAEDPVALQQLVIHAERAKRDLSAVGETRVMIPYVAITDKGPVHLNLPLTRATLETLIAPLLERIRTLLRDTLEHAGVSENWINTVVMVGGASRMPCVRTLLANLLPEKIHFRQDLNPEEIVAKGAGVLAGILGGQYRDITFRDVTPYDLGVEDDQGAFVTVIPRGTAYPLEVFRLFTTIRDDQEEVTIHVQQRAEALGQVISLGSFALENLPRARAGEPDIRVTFAIDPHGILRVRAEETLSGVRGEIEVHRHETS